MEHIKHHLQYHRWPALLLGALFLLTTVPFVSRLPYNWDAAQFVLGVQHFSVLMHQPQPPGYPLFILFGKAISLLTEPHTALVVISILFAAGSVAVLYSLIWLAWSERWLATLISLAWIMNPLFWLYRETALTYTIDAFAAITMALLTYLVLTRFRTERSVRWMYVSAVSLAVFGGFRPSILGLLGSFILVQWIDHYIRTKQWQAIAISAGLLIGVGLAWSIPLVVMNGGWSEYQQITGSQFQRSAEATSVLFGASWSATWEQIKLVWRTYLDVMNGFIILLVGGVAYIGYRMYKRTWRMRWPLFWIAIAWAVPAGLMYTVVHFGQVGYILLLAPLGYLGVAAILRWTKHTLTQRWETVVFLLVGCTIVLDAAVFLWATPIVGHPNYIPQRRVDQLMQKLAQRHPLLFHMNAYMIQERTQKLRTLEQVIRAYDANEVIVVAGRNVMYPAINGLPIRNDELYRELAAIFPEYTVIEVAPERGYMFRSRGFTTEYVNGTKATVDNTIQYVIFALEQIDPADLPEHILLEQQSGYSIGVMTQPFTFLGYTVQRSQDVPLSDIQKQ